MVYNTGLFIINRCATALQQLGFPILDLGF